MSRLSRLVGARRRIALLGASAALALLGLPAQAGVEVAGQSVGGDLPLMSDNIDVLGSIPMPGVIGARFKDNVMYVTGGEGLRTFDVSDPALPKPLGHLPLPHFENEDVSLGGNTLVISADQALGIPNMIYVIDISNPALPRLRNQFRINVQAHIGNCVADCRYVFITGDTGVYTFDTTTGAQVGRWAIEIGGTHDIQFDSAGYAWVVGGNGTGAWDVTNPLVPKKVAMTDARGNQPPYNDFIHHNSLRPDVTPGVPGDVLLITEEDYLNAACSAQTGPTVGPFRFRSLTPPGLFQSWKINGALSTTSPAVLTPLDTWDISQGVLPGPEDTRAASAAFCSSHYFTESGGLVANAWYQQGVRFLDVRDPANIRQVGYFVIPDGEVWAAYFAPTDPTQTIVYALDLTHGIDILRIDRTAALASEGATMAPSIVSSFPAISAPSEKWGWGCRIPV